LIEGPDLQAGAEEIVAVARVAADVGERHQLPSAATSSSASGFASHFRVHCADVGGRKRAATG